MSQTENGETPERAELVLFPGALGDFVCFFPALRALRARHEGPVVVACGGDLPALAVATGLGPARSLDGVEASWLFSADPPPEAERFYSRFAFVRSFTGSAEPAVARHLRAWLGERFAVHPFRPDGSRHASEHFLHAIGAEWTGPARLVVEPREILGALDRLRPALNNRPRLLVHPGSGGKLKKWSTEGFVAIAMAWRAEGGESIALLGPAEQSGEAASWRAARIPWLRPRDAVDLAAIATTADVWLGNDSGPSHLAAALGIPGLALFGPTDPAVWAPRGERFGVHRPVPWCSVDETSTADSVKRISAILRGFLEPTSDRSP